MNNMLTEQEIINKYGAAGDPHRLAIIDLPYPMRIAWDIKKSVTHIQCHSLITHKLMTVFNETKSYYGYEKIVELGIDLFGGCTNVRLKRGSKTEWSRHSWGIAIDIDPVRNGWKTKWNKAQLSKPEYAEFVAIFYRNGFLNYGKEFNFDAMHFEISA